MGEDDDAEVFYVRWAPEDNLLGCGCGDGVVRIYHSDDGRLAYNLEREGNAARLPTTCLRWRPATNNAKTKNVLLAANADGTVCHWHVTSRKCLHTISEGENQVYALDYMADGSAFATAGKDYVVRVYDEATKSLVSKLETGWVGAPSPGHSNRVCSSSAPTTPTSSIRAAGTTPSRSGTCAPRRRQARCTALTCAATRSTSRATSAWTGSWRPNKALQLWDVRTRTLCKDVPFRHPALEGKGESCHVYASQFSKPSAAGPGGAPPLIAAGLGLERAAAVHARRELLGHRDDEGRRAASTASTSQTMAPALPSPAATASCVCSMCHPVGRALRPTHRAAVAAASTSGGAGGAAHAPQRLPDASKPQPSTAASNAVEAD